MTGNGKTLGRLAAKMRSLLRCTQGVSAVEFALVGPMLALLAVGGADFGLMVNEKMRLQSAVRAGAQAGYGNSGDTANMARVVREASGLDAQAVSVSAATSCGCADGSTVSCAGICAGGAVRTYVTVTATESRPMLITYPGLSNRIALSATATLRVR